MEFWEAVLAPRLPAAVRDAIVTIDHAAASIGLPRGVGMYATLMLVTLVMMRIVAWVLGACSARTRCTALPRGMLTSGAVGRRRGAVQKGDRVLLVGPCGSGKTIMIYKASSASTRPPTHAHAPSRSLLILCHIFTRACI